MNIKALRNEAGWTQERLAGAMAAAGFSWKRITCAEVEVGSRRISLEELLGIAMLFSVPALELLIPDDSVALDMPMADVKGPQVEELLLGSGGRLGRGGVEWTAPLSVLAMTGRTDERPAPDLWRARGSRPSSGRPHSRGRKHGED